MTAAAILLVDDDPSFRAVTVRALRAAGYAVEDAADGADGLRMFHAELPDLVITDILMPDRDGVELIGAIRRDAGAAKILAISGGGQIGPLSLLSLAAELGADAVLAKPFGSEELLRVVEGLVGPGAPARD